MISVLVLGIGVAGAASAQARQTHRRHKVVQQQTKQPRAQIPYTYSFYPEEVEDGVSGNLPFNNQIRKFKDPLNANGGR